MPDVPKPDFDKIRQAHRQLRRQWDMNRHERFHRAAIALLAVLGFLGWILFGHLRILLIIAVIYFIVAVSRGNITCAGRRDMMRGRHKDESDGDS